jgi:hypothetical protein
MRHGHKSERQRFDGYKIHAAATTSDRPLLTAIDVSPGCDYDGQLAPGLIDSQPERPQRLLGDAAYGDSETREQLEEREVEVLAPVPEPPGIKACPLRRAREGERRDGQATRAARRPDRARRQLPLRGSRCRHRRPDGLQG